ncbi:MAG: hypothetical protein LLG00_07325 [Planctomycetaceae bacterium]|nr:hypothetical protein [Planctomycetaceae bacterium]
MAGSLKVGLEGGTALNPECVPGRERRIQYTAGAFGKQRRRRVDRDGGWILRDRRHALGIAASPVS